MNKNKTIKKQIKNRAKLFGNIKDQEENDLHLPELIP